MIPEEELMLQAKARRRRAEAVPARDEMSLGNVGRQVGLTARAAGPTGKSVV